MLFNEKTTEIIKMCRCCFMCRHACPTFLATKLDSHTPRGYAINLARINEGLGDWDEKGFERLYHCSQCGLCKELCEFHWPEDEMVLEGRREMIKAGKAPAEVVKLCEEMSTNGQKENDLIEAVSYNKKNTNVLYIAGTALQNGQKETIERAVKIFERTDTDYTMLSEEDISGIVLYELGCTKESEEWAKSFIETITELKPEKVVTSCAHTYDFIRNKLSDFKLELSIPVMHMVEFVAQMMDEEKLVPEKAYDEKVMYHDPCKLGRGSGIYDTPREIIKKYSGKDVVEFHHCKSEAECCGAGASVDLTYPEVSVKVAMKRVQQAVDEDIKTIVTACPNCKKVFEDAIDKLNGDIAVRDITEYVLKDQG